MKQRNRLLFLVLLFISIFLGACSQNSAQTEITGKGIVELINENREREYSSSLTPLVIQFQKMIK